MIIRKTHKGGFTLVELMIVVAIVGVLAVLAVYGVRKYIANAKTAEAKNSLGQIGKDAVSAFEGERMAGGVLATGSSTAVIRALCQTAANTVPTTSAGIAGKKYQSSKADWSPPLDVTNGAGFPCLKFEMTAPQYYMYNYTSDATSGTPASGTKPGTAANAGTKFSAIANGNLNGDTTLSTFTLAGAIAEGRPIIAPAITEVSPEE
jgi:type IV pilus assembly protein PilA